MSRKKWIIIAAAAVVIAAVVLLVAVNSPLKQKLWKEKENRVRENESFAVSKEIQAKAEELGLTAVSETGSLALFLNKKNCSTAVYDKKNGEVFYTVPQEADSDPFASPYYKDKLKAALNVTFLNEYVQASEMDSFTNCVNEEQAEVSEIEGGVRITYTIGTTLTKVILPTAISEERFDKYLSEMPEKTQKKIKRNYTFLDTSVMKKSEYEEQLESYPGLELHNLYILKSGTKDYLRDELAGYFVEQGYTAEDLIADIEENCGEASTNKPWFIIPVDYYLEGDSFVCEINPEEVSYNTDGYYLTDIELLPYFAAASAEENGYLFVPDGSGALIRLNNGKTAFPAYSDKIYGVDYAQTSLSIFKSELEEDFSIKLPVFGLKTENRAWLGVVEGGTGYAGISADISGKTTSYNHIFADFSYMTCGSISLGSIVGANSFYMYSQPDTAENYRVRYFFLQKDNADYCSMAERYRNYLLERGELERAEVLKDTPFYVEFIGAINRDESTMGVKYDATVPVTTFAEAEQISERLKESGVDNLNVIMSGWTKGGLRGEAQVSLKAESKLKKGRMNLAQLAQKLNSMGISFYPMLELQYVYDNTMLDGYSSQSHAPRYFDRSIVKGTGYVYANGMNSKHMIELISPAYSESLVKRSTERLKKLGVSAAAVDSAAHELYSDYDNSKYTDRQMALELNRNALVTANEELGGKLLGYNANSYAVKTLSDIVNAPTASNHLRLIDEDIPFYEIVFKGVVNLAGEAMNLADDYERELLKSAECGMGVFFKWMNAENSVVVDTMFDQLYSVNCDTWFEKATADYKKLSKACEGLGDKKIVSHEKAGNGVYVTEFEGGARIAVNYSDTAVTVEGVTLSPKDFVRLR